MGVRATTSQEALVGAGPGLDGTTVEGCPTATDWWLGMPAPPWPWAVGAAGLGSGAGPGCDGMPGPNTMLGSAHAQVGGGDGDCSRLRYA